MENAASFNNHVVIDLFTEELITAPLSIRADLGERTLDATLSADGSVTIGAQVYSNLDQAMQASHRQQASTSDAWQFWTWFSDERQAWTPLEHLRAKFCAKDIQADIRTSETHPLRIDSVNIPGSQGRIGLTFCPGKRCEGLYGGTWARNLNLDLQAVIDWGGTTLISLMEAHEFPLLGVPEFAQVLSESVLQWHHLPIQDMQPPNANFEAAWRLIGPDLHEQLARGESIVIHCRGGLGRTGLLAARMLVEAGLSPVDAVARVRKARTHAIETYAQEHYVLTEHWQNHSKQYK